MRLIWLVRFPLAPSCCWIDWSFFLACCDNSSTPTKDWYASRVVWVEPDDSGKTVLGAIEKAKYSVDISIYELRGPRIPEALKTAKAKGVAIRIIYNGQFFAGSNPSDQRYDQQYAVTDELKSAPGDGSVFFHWSSNNFNITHQKTILIDASMQGRALEAMNCVTPRRPTLPSVGFPSGVRRPVFPSRLCLRSCRNQG